MEQMHNWKDIINVIAEKIDTPFAKIIRSGTVSAIGAANPVAGVVAGIGNDFLTEYSTFKFGLLLEGLSSGSSVEKRLNELYTYVNASPEKAISVANLFRKTVNAECPKVCIIYGLLLANHLNNNTDFTQDELIVCKALENATDHDLNNFKDIMEKYLKTNSDEIRVVFPEKFEDLADFTTTCNWAVYNRIFVSEENRFETDMGFSGNLTPYFVAEPARVLIEYINEAHQVWNYSY